MTINMHPVVAFLLVFMIGWCVYHGVGNGRHKY